MLGHLAVANAYGFESERLVCSVGIVGVGHLTAIDRRHEVVFGHHEYGIAQRDAAEVDDADAAALGFLKALDPGLPAGRARKVVHSQQPRVVLNVVLGHEPLGSLLSRAFVAEKVEQDLLVRIELRLARSARFGVRAPGDGEYSDSGSHNGDRPGSAFGITHDRPPLRHQDASSKAASTSASKAQRSKPWAP